MKLTNKIVLGILTLSTLAVSAKDFVHPGARSSRYDLDFVKAKIELKAEPWTSRLDDAKNAGGDSEALGLALDWYYTGNENSAKAAIDALAYYIGETPYEPAPNNGGNQSSLEGAWVASVLAPAAEIMNEYSGWGETDKNAVKEMFRTVFLPAMLKMSYWNGNVDLTQIDALLSIAVFIEDEAAFNEGITRLSKRLPAYFYLSSDDASVRRYANGTYNWSGVNEPLLWVDGVSQELCRDNGHHAQFAIAAALAAMETAYIQGVDLYTPNQERMVDAMELMALQLDTKDMQGVCEGTATDEHGDRDRYNTLEIGYNHYHNRKGVSMPNTYAEILKELRAGRQQFNIFHETLTHGDIDYSGAVNTKKIDKKFNTQLIINQDGFIEVSSLKYDIEKISIYDIGGVLVNSYSGELKSGEKHSLKLSDQVNKGMFFVEVQTNTDRQIHKLIK